MEKNLDKAIDEFTERLTTMTMAGRKKNKELEQETREAIRSVLRRVAEMARS
jgi:hypothetical protein